ncbi:FAD:protein FMN transferase [Lignipirellula cremea]|uniref:FAD:protein FMN transferase n=1 Tax=Lignipirellula cremea TaxID=2528010 RepID=A0A518DVR2_9BACT|nr:FAD:protein FMN transferase [Lignipirellula cremea]QDU95926.1 Thiamine biosynthesis lipoprotein ApbE precursor [Lignipirellula cremea]
MISNRRQFFCVAAGGAVCWPLVHSLAGQAFASEDGQPLAVARRTSWALGSDVSMVALHADEATARAAIDAAFAELERVEQVMSIYRPDSQLSQLNRTGRLDRPHRYLVEVLREAEDVSRRSEGAFDITVQPLWSLYYEAQKANRLPAADEVAAARRQVDWRRVETTAARIRLHGQGTQITLNGIAQGFAADKARDAIQQHGVQHALINTGEIGALGRTADGQPWTVGIQHPRRPSAYLSLAKLAGRSLATSGDYATTFSPDFRQNHLLDPHAGCSPTELASVSVAAPSAMTADALSTAIAVLGPARGEELAAQLPGVDVLLVQKDGRIRRSGGFPV